MKNSRIKDLVDILLLANLDNSVQADRLRTAIEAVFSTRGDVLPTQIGQFPQNWQTWFRKASKELGLPYETLDQATDAVRMFVDPVLEGLAVGVWNPESWNWGKR